MASIGDLFAGAANTVDQTFGQITSAGVPAVLSGIEQYGAQQLQSLAQANQAAATQATQTILQQPTTPIGKAISDSLASIASGAVFKQYGSEIIVGLLILLVLRKLV
jgi:hypothetical protein